MGNWDIYISSSGCDTEHVIINSASVLALTNYASEIWVLTVSA